MENRTLAGQIYYVLLHTTYIYKRGTLFYDECHNDDVKIIITRHAELSATLCDSKTLTLVKL